ncbi:MAG: response regulator [Verrucomicrobia bacterium]|nr:response regulator [Verrucomicrobiota bacterium]
MSHHAELEEVQTSLDELHARLQEVVGYGSIIVGCTQEGEMLRDFSESIVKSAEQATLAELALHERVARLREALKHLTAAPPPAAESEGAAATDWEAAEPEPEPEPEPAPPPGPDLSQLNISNADGPKELLLVIDHDEKALLLAEALLTADGYRVITAQNGFEALDIYRYAGSVIDLVMIEVAMPQISGEEIFNEIRTLRPDAAAVVSGGFSEPARVSAMLMKGLNGFVPKPYKQDRLLRQLHAVLSRRRRTAVPAPETEEWR